MSLPLHSPESCFLKNPGRHWHDHDLSGFCLQTSLFFRLHSLGHPSAMGSRVLPGFLNDFLVVCGLNGGCLVVVVGGLVGKSLRGGPARIGFGVVGSVGRWPDLKSWIGFLVMGRSPVAP